MKLTFNKIYLDLAKHENVGERLLYWRIQSGLRLKEIAEISGWPLSVYGDYERGRRKSPGFTMIKKLIKILVENQKGIKIKTYIHKKKEKV